MDIKTPQDIKFIVNSRAFRGAPEPDFDPEKFNESRIPDGMRFKSVHPSWDDAKTLRVEWETQDCYDDSGLDEFAGEAARWYDENNLNDKEIDLIVELSDRYSDWTASFRITHGSPKTLVINRGNCL